MKDNGNWHKVVPEIGTYFRTKDGSMHYIAQVEGYIRDETGEVHSIHDIETQAWTLAELEEAKLKAKEIAKFFRERK